MNEAAVSAFIIAASRMVTGFRAGLRSEEPLKLATYDLLADTAEQLPEYSPLVSSAMTLERYQARVDPRTGFKLSQDHKCRSELRAYLMRTRFYQELWLGRMPSAGAAAVGFAAATEGLRKCEAVRLIPLDGLEIWGAEAVSLPGGARLVKLAAPGWSEFFESDLFGSPDIDQIAHLWSLELRTTLVDPPPNPMWIHFDSPHEVAMRHGGAWIHCINLSEKGFVRPVAIYTKLQTLLALMPVEVLNVSEPTMIPEYDYQQDREWEHPFVSIDVNAREPFVKTVTELFEGRTAASSRSSRTETALHWFTRIGDQLFGHDAGRLLDERILEELVPDCFTILEALLLAPRERGKGDKISARAASLVATEDSTLIATRDAIKAAYDLRNDLVHGDARPSHEKLEGAAENLHVWVKQVLVALLRLHGDRDAVVAGVSDASVRERNRALVPRLQ